MADNDSRLPPVSTSEAPSPPFVPDSQLAFPFVARAGAVRAAPEPPDTSRRALRPRTPARSLVAPRVERSLEEIQLEHGVAVHMPSGKLLRLQLTDNRYTIISVQRGRECYRVRVHRMFAGVEPRLLRALARYVVHNDQRASTQLSAYIEDHQAEIRRPTRRTRATVVRSRGQVHDLGAILDRLNRKYFDGKLDVRITWGSARRHPAQRSIRVGAYSVEDRLIRVHPVLDQPIVPGYFLDWIVFHEMLHSKHAIVRVGGRRCFHPPAFTREEKAFPDYCRARLWEKANLDRLLG
jgi:hypothetical protein